MADQYGTEEMFDIPSIYKSAKKRTAPSDKDKWTKHRGRRISCDVCILNIHRGAVIDCQFGHATQSLQRGERKWFLCSWHATQIKNGERKL